MCSLANIQSAQNGGRTLMRLLQVQVPLALLRTRELTPAAKLLWVVCHLDTMRNRKRSHAPTHLARRTGLARSTVYKAFAQLVRTSWGAMYRERTSGKRRLQTRRPSGTSSKVVRIPVDLADSRGSVDSQAIVCFGLLQGLPEFNGRTGQFKWAELAAATRLHVKTVKRAVHSLVQAGWVGVQQKNRLAPIRFILQHADEAWRRGAQARLQWSSYGGQALMLEYLSLIVDSREFVDDAAAGFLINPRTQQLLQFDRFYPLHRVAFEFNGRQHYEPTELYSKQQVAVQRARDATKRTICASQGIKIVVVHAEDLSLEGMLRKVGDLLPLRDLSGYPRTIRHLDNAAGRYMRAARTA